MLASLKVLRSGVRGTSKETETRSSITRSPDKGNRREPCPFIPSLRTTIAPSHTHAATHGALLSSSAFLKGRQALCVRQRQQPFN